MSTYVSSRNCNTKLVVKDLEAFETYCKQAGLIYTWTAEPPHFEVEDSDSRGNAILNGSVVGGDDIFTGESSDSFTEEITAVLSRCEPGSYMERVDDDTAEMTRLERRPDGTVSEDWMALGNPFETDSHEKESRKREFEETRMTVQLGEAVSAVAEELGLGDQLEYTPWGISSMAKEISSELAALKSDLAAYQEDVHDIQRATKGLPREFSNPMNDALFETVSRQAQGRGEQDIDRSTADGGEYSTSFTVSKFVVRAGAKEAWVKVLGGKLPDDDYFDALLADPEVMEKVGQVIDHAVETERDRMNETIFKCLSNVMDGIAGTLEDASRRIEAKQALCPAPAPERAADALSAAQKR